MLSPEYLFFCLLCQLKSQPTPHIRLSLQSHLDPVHRLSPFFPTPRSYTSIPQAFTEPPLLPISLLTLSFATHIGIATAVSGRSWRSWRVTPSANACLSSPFWYCPSSVSPVLSCYSRYGRYFFSLISLTQRHDLGRFGGKRSSILLWSFHIMWRMWAVSQLHTVSFFLRNLCFWNCVPDFCIRYPPRYLFLFIHSSSHLALVHYLFYRTFWREPSLAPQKRQRPQRHTMPWRR